MRRCSTRVDVNTPAEVPSHPNHVKFGIFLSHLLISVKHAANRCIIKAMKLRREDTMRSRVQTLRNLILVGILLGFIGSFGSWENIFSAQQQPQPPDPCSKENPTAVVKTPEELQAAVNDKDCGEIILINNEYRVNLVIQRSEPLILRAAEQGQDKVILKGPEPNRQTIFITNSKDITIEGLTIQRDQGNIGVFIEKSKGITLKGSYIQNYPEAAVVINPGSSVSLEQNTITGNKVGISIKGQSTATLTKDKIESNQGNGIEVEKASVTLMELEIAKNAGCGVKVSSDGTVKDGYGDNGRSNWIYGNKGGNTCPWELSREIRKPEILVPKHFAKIQEAIKDAEPVRGEDDRPYTILLSPPEQGEYAENLCIDRSVTIAPDPRVGQLVRIHSIAQEPTIAIGTQKCPLHKEEKGNIDKEAGDQISSVRIYIKGISIAGPSSGATADGFQIGTLHSNGAQKTFLKVKLQDSSIENFVRGFLISPSAKDHKLDVQILGTQPLQDAVCTGREYPSYLNGEIPFIPSSVSINNNQEGIRIENLERADVSVHIRDVEIKGNTLYGIFYEGGGNSKLTIERSRVIGNQQGIGVTSKGTDPQASDEITVQLASIRENKGGIKLEAPARSKLDSKLIDVDIRQNTGFGVSITGNVETTLKASSDIPISSPEPPHNCGITDNLGPGVHAHGSAVLTIENMFVAGNGYEDERKTKPVPRGGEVKVGPDGIFASDSVQLTVRNTYIGPNNAGVGIALQASNKSDALKAAFEDNYIDSNRKWGISYIIRNCLEERTMPDNFYGNVEGQNNVFVGNGFRLSKGELAGGPDQGLGRGQVCPKELDFLVVRVQ
jgi:hypothetical protein